MSGDSWFEEYAAWSPTVVTMVAQDEVVEADPVGVVGAILQHLASRGVPVVIDGSYERLREAAGRILDLLGVEQVDGPVLPLGGGR